LENPESTPLKNSDSDSTLDDLESDLLMDTPETSPTSENAESSQLSSNRYVEKLESHIKASKEIAKYSLERFDILIISLSGGGLVLSISLVKDVIKNFEKVDHTLLKLTWIAFGSSLVLNLFSQITAYYANNKEIKISKNLIRKERGKELKGNQENLECHKSILNCSTVTLNAFSVLAFVTAIILLIIFMDKYI